MISLSVLGAGSWGTALAQAAAENGVRVTLWGRNESFIEALNLSKENQRYLPKVKLNENIIFTTDLKKACVNKLIVIAVPTQQQRTFLKLISPHLSQDTILINVAKGLEINSGNSLSAVYEEELPGILDRYVVLYGPSHAEEVGKKMPTVLVSASKNAQAAEKVQQVFMNEFLRVYTSDDLIGVEFGGALKNIIALAIGMTIGLGYGDNARAALMTRGLAEITRLGTALGANPMTFLGLTGMGDLIVTCTSEHSRNRCAGIKLGKGLSLKAVLSDMNMVVEGVPTTQAAYYLAKEHHISMPIVEAMHGVLFEEADVFVVAKDLMSRNKKSEMEDFLKP